MRMDMGSRAQPGLAVQMNPFVNACLHPVSVELVQQRIHKAAHVMPSAAEAHGYILAVVDARWPRLGNLEVTEANVWHAVLAHAVSEAVLDMKATAAKQGLNAFFYNPEMGATGGDIAGAAGIDEYESPMPWNRMNSATAYSGRWRNRQTLHPQQMEAHGQEWYTDPRELAGAAQPLNFLNANPGMPLPGRGVANSPYERDRALRVLIHRRHMRG